MIQIKRLARVLLPIASALLALSSLDQSGPNNTGFVSGAILSFVAAYWWHVIGPQKSES